MIAAFAAALVTVPLAGGSLRRLAQVELRWTSLLFVSLFIQVVIIEIVPADTPGLNVLHLSSYALAAGFLVCNRRLPGMWLVVAGAAGNVAAIAANGGVMPASQRALEIAGKAGATEHFANSAAVAHARLQFLGDVFAIPQGFPLANVFSVGDVLLVIGGAVMVHSLCGSRWTHKGVRADDLTSTRDLGRAAVRAIFAS